MRLHFLLLLLGLAFGLPVRVALAQVIAPNQGGEVSAVRITATTIELSFGTSGTGHGRVVSIATAPGGMPVPLAANDGQFYSAATTYGRGAPLGKGYVVYNGTGHSATVTGLQPSTYYYITNAEYNTDGDTIVYNTKGTSISLATRRNTVAPTPAPLPVELTSFTGTVNAHSFAVLNWTTASERNTSYFSLERSTDGTSFTEAGRVSAATSSDQVHTYNYIEQQQLRAVTYYRLRQVDLDGTASYSSVITLAPTVLTERLMEVYPNPSAGRTIQIVLQGFSSKLLTLRLVDAVGRPVFSQELAPTVANYQIPLLLPQSLSAGTYLLTLTGNSAPIQTRVIISD